MGVAAKTNRLRKVKTILISQPEPSNPKNPYANIADKFKVDIDFRPFIQVDEMPNKEFRRLRLNLGEYNGIIFSSKNSIDHYFRVMREMRESVSATTKYFCFTESIALYLQKFIEYRKRKVFYDKEKRIGLTGLKPILEKHKETTKFLYPCANIHQSSVPDYLNENGFDFSEAAMYQVNSSDLSDLEKIFYDMIVFFTPLGVKSLFDNFPDFQQNDTLIACFGATTAKSIEDKKLRLDVRAPAPGTPSMTMAIEKYLETAG